jgi:poly(3-hydroxybutyrate) depolymerase
VVVRRLALILSPLLAGGLLVARVSSRAEEARGAARVTIAAAQAAPAARPADAGASAAAASSAAADTARLDAEARAEAKDVRIAPSPTGAIGAWLVAGPFRAGKPALDTPDEAPLTPSLGAALGGEREDPGGHGKKKLPAAKWELASSGDGAIDLKAALDARGSDLIAYAGGSLHVERAGHYLLLLGVDDGVRVLVDGKAVYSRDDARPVRDDDDAIGLDLTAGDHAIVLKLHQRSGAWAFRARFVETSLAPPPGAYLELAGTTADDARALATKMSWVSLDRAFDAASDPPRYRPKLTVRFPEGAPRGVPLRVTTKLESTFELDAGGVPVTAAGVGELVVALPPVAPFTGSRSLESTIAGRDVKHVFAGRPQAEQALVRMTKALASLPAEASWLPDGSRTTAEFLASRLTSLLAKGDYDLEAQVDEAKDLDRIAAALEKRADPFETRTGPMRRAIRSRHDGEPTEFGLYVPTWYRPGSKARLPLVVGLHGLNGYPLGMMRWLFGGDDPKKPQGWEDRHIGTLPAVDAIIVTPEAHGNTLYRELGEDDVMQIVAWAMKTYPIDPARITITGPSMGGIGSAAIPFHHPQMFAAAMPLCGYHSYLIRGDVAGHPIRPWERFLAEERSNVMWAENGEHLPLYIVHGTKDLPEANSGVLIERYEKLNFSIKHEHPDSGHNVWQETYEDLKGLKWLLRRSLDLHPSHVSFKTTRTRWNKSAWVTVDEIASETGWADVDARVRGKSKITLKTTNVAELSLARDPKLLPAGGAIDVTVDGHSESFDEGEAIVLHKDGSAWAKGPASHAGLYKHGTVTGPIRDVYNDPILFVWADDDEARANEEVARAFAKIRFGVQVSYPMMSDAEFLARGEPLANDRALFLVGRKNRVLAALEKTSPFPVRVEDSAVTVGATRFTGHELGAAFIRPNPARPDRYVVVMAGADVTGMLRATSLPDLLPDFVVWDEGLAPARGKVLLGAASVRAGGVFKNDWSLPAVIADPLAKAAPPAPPSEHDGEPESE